MRNKTAGLFLLLAFALLFTGLKPDLKAESDFSSPTGNFIPVATNIYLYKNDCNVYVLKSGQSAILFDAGSGESINHPEKIGVKKVEWSQNTYYYCDHSAGSVPLKNQNTKIAIGEAEADALTCEETKPPFKIPGSFLLNGEPEDWGRKMTPFESPDLDRKLKGNEEFNWKEYNEQYNFARRPLGNLDIFG